jgi:GMP synthase (glutamine-hydrolysing)
MTRAAIAIRHVPFEDLGILERVATDAGYECRYLDAGLVDLGDGGDSRVVEADLLVVLGGPIGAYEENRYPFLTGELRSIERRCTDSGSLPRRPADGPRPRRSRLPGADEGDRLG